MRYANRGRSPCTGRRGAPAALAIGALLEAVAHLPVALGGADAKPGNGSFTAIRGPGEKNGARRLRPARRVERPSQRPELGT